jgi:DNA-binding NarL/FixJ family response regulator
VIFREATRALLERDGFEVVGEAGDGETAISMVQKLLPDVVILDIGMPIINGLDAAKAIARDVPGIFMIVLSVHEEEVYMVEALRAGVHGYVLKSQSDGELSQSINAVSLGAIYLAPGISERVINNITSKMPMSSNELTVRERQVLEMVAQGKTTREIALVLHLSPKTIESHRGRIMQKLDIHHTAQLVSYAVRHDFIKS